MKAEALTAQVVDFNAALRARVNAMANEQLAMQEALPSIPPAQVVAYINRMDAHADRLSRLASRLLSDHSLLLTPYPLLSSTTEVDHV